MEARKHGNMEKRKFGSIEAGDIEAWKYWNMEVLMHGNKKLESMEAGKHKESHGITCITCCS